MPAAKDRGAETKGFGPEPADGTSRLTDCASNYTDNRTSGRGKLIADWLPGRGWAANRTVTQKGQILGPSYNYLRRNGLNNSNNTLFLPKIV